MENSIIKIWKEKGKILEGVKNSLFKTEHVEDIAAQRKAICEACPHIDTEGSKCMVPGTNPCCGLCGCSLAFKLRSLSSACDDSRWKAEVTEEEENAINEQIKSKENDTNIHS